MKNPKKTKIFLYYSYKKKYNNILVEKSFSFLYENGWNCFERNIGVK